MAVGAYAITRDPENPLDPSEGATLNSYVIIDKDGVTVIVPRAEMGQGVQTSLAALVAEELEVPMSMVRVEHGPPAKAYANSKFILPRSYDSEPPGKLVNTVMEAMPRMMGISGQPSSSDGKNLDPMENYGIKVMSMGFMVEEDTPMIWRGPMVQSALEQMLRDVNWGELDVLIVDMPPGTGDAQLTMAQRVPLTGAIIVSTPQDIALLDARRGL
ncbi:P-loop NTPase, partial [Mycolicibacterium poriferae]|uniref:P-loop NTPase n=1 Tax=Mycolicibacterium poriferae TaxID=39694 RepID=UPI0024BB11C5